MRGSLHFEETDFLQLDDGVGVDVVDFMQHISTKHHGHHVADKMRTTSWT